MPAQQQSAVFDLSGGVQSSTNRLIKRQNEVASAKNAAFNYKIGSAARRYGYEQVGTTIESGNNSLGAIVYKYYGNNKIMVGINNSTSTNATVRYLDNAGYWTNIITDAATNTKFSFLNHLDELYVAGYSKDTNSYLTLTNIDSSLTASTSRNVQQAPKARFIAEFGGSLYAIGVQIAGKTYRDRIYKSSGALGFVTRVQNIQKGLLQQLKLDSVRYLKAGMNIDIYSAGSNTKVIDSLTIISVLKNTNTITFAPTAIDVKDNDEVYFEDRKGQLSMAWNTDYPTDETADFIRIPPGVEQNPELTGYAKTNSRLLFFTRNSMWKWDGANLINVSETIGCTSQATVKSIGSWVIFLHNSGVWGYNDSTGQLKLLSRTIQNYIEAITQNGLENASAGVIGRVYKLSVGEVQELDSITTSTSTSSTSTSSTSSSTSSTSTSSTSTSSTSTSTTKTTTSTSSTSSSTSSTSTSVTTVSTSSTSSSTSLSTSSTTTQTIASTKNVLRLVYDFDMNAWWMEYHKREIRYQFPHTMHGYTKNYFTDDTGRLFRDDIGNLDQADTIPFELTIGRRDMGTRFLKKYDAMIVESEAARGTQIFISLDNGNWINVGQIERDVQEVRIPSNILPGRDINIKFSNNDQGNRPVIDGVEVFYSVQEVKVG